MIRIFFDTEFTALTDEAKLISIGFVDERGERTFYAELSDTYGIGDLSDFASNDVIPLLEGQLSSMSMREVGERLTDWLAFYEEPVKLATDSLMWDWPWIQKIFQQHGAWPKCLHGEPLLLTMNYLNDYDEFEEAVAMAFAGGLRRHHALDDAKANRLGWIAAGGDCGHGTD